MDCIVITIVWTITGVHVPTWYNATHNYANSSCNSLCLKFTGVKAPLYGPRQGYQPKILDETF